MQAGMEFPPLARSLFLSPCAERSIFFSVVRSFFLPLLFFFLSTKVLLKLPCRRSLAWQKEPLYLPFLSWSWNFAVSGRARVCAEVKYLSFCEKVVIFVVTDISALKSATMEWVLITDKNEWIIYKWLLLFLFDSLDSSSCKKKDKFNTLIDWNPQMIGYHVNMIIKWTIDIGE